MPSLPTILVIGEILFDVFPTYTRLGGAPFNFAYHLDKLGFPVCFVSRIGNDDYGRRILEELDQRAFNNAYLQKDAHFPTGTVSVRLDDKGVPEFDIIADVAYDRLEYDAGIHAELVNRAGLIYFGTLAQRTRQGFTGVQRFISRRRPGTIGFYDINLRPDCYSDDVVRASLEQANVLKLNVEELQVCKQICRFEGDDRKFISYLKHAYAIETIALTRGEQGSALYAAQDIFTSTPPPEMPVADTVGAGDGFAAMLAAGMLLGWPRRSILSRASEFASRICGIKGAIPDSSDFYDGFRVVNQGA